MSSGTRSQSFELPCDTTEATRFITLAQKTFSRDAPNWPNKYHDFVKLLTSYREERIDLPFFLKQAQTYLCAHPQLVPKLNAFLPTGHSVISPPTSPASNWSIAGRRRASRAPPSDRELTEQKSLRYIEKVKATYRKSDGSDGLEARMFLDLLQKKKDGEEDVAKLRNKVHTLFYLHPSLANEFDHFLHHEYFNGRGHQARSPATAQEPETIDSASPTISPTLEKLALPDEDLPPTQKTLDPQTRMDIDTQPNSTSLALNHPRTPSPVPSLSFSSRTVSVDSSPSSHLLTSHAPSSPRMEDIELSGSGSVRASPILAPLPFYPAFSATSGEARDGWGGSPAPAIEARTPQKTLFGKGLMDLHLDRRQRPATPPSPIARVHGFYPQSCNPNDTTFTNGVVSMPPELENREDGWIHGAPRSKSVLNPFGVATGRTFRLEDAPTQAKPAFSFATPLPYRVSILHLPIQFLPPKPISTPFSLRRSYAKVVVQGRAQARPSSLTPSRTSPLAPPVQPAANTSDGAQSTLQLSTLAPTWAKSASLSTARNISSSSLPKRELKGSKSRRGVGSDPDPVIPAESIRRTYGYGAVGDGRPRGGV
ncbi:hypothetical protein FRC01_005663 [Tulasnella sp. 417]|nr:hypothetical protein FRC01_005663 [Tulasnella sp. 417]